MPDIVVFVSTLDQLNQLHNEHTSALEAARIISLDLDVSAYARVLGYQFAELMDFLSIAEIDQIYTEAAALKENWHQFVAAEAQFEGVNPLVMERQTLTYFFRDALLSVRLFQSVYARLKFEQVILFSSEQRPFVVASASVDVRSAIWRHMAEAHDLRIQMIAPTRSQKRKWIVYRDKVLGTVSVILKSATNPLQWELLKHRLTKKREPGIAFIVTVNETNRYAYVAKELKLRFKERFFSFTLGARRQGSVYVPQHDVLFRPFGLLPGLTFFKARSFSRRLYKLWKQRTALHSGEFPQILNNPYLHFQFDFFFHKQVPNALENFIQAKKILSILKPAVVLTTSTGSIYQSAIVEAARQQNIASVILPHSATPEGRDTIITGDYVIAWSKDFIKQWHNLGIEKDRIFITGLPRSLVDDGYRQEALSAALTSGDTDKKTILILLATASVAGVPIVDLDIHLQSLRTLVQIPEHLKGKVRIIFKLHPVWDYQYLYEQLAADVKDVEIVRLGNLANLVRTTDVSLLVNIPTSAYLLPLYENRPVLFIRTALCLQGGIGLSEHGSEALITSDKSIWSKLESVLFSLPDRERILQDNLRYKQWMGLDNNRPINTLVNSIETIAHAQIGK